MSLSDQQEQFLLDFILLVQFAKRIGFKVTPGEIRRTYNQQQIYVRTGRSKTMRSAHLEGLAGDLNFFKDNTYLGSLPGEKAVEVLKPVGVFWESLATANVWGGNFDRDFERRDPWIDVPHFQRNKI